MSLPAYPHMGSWKAQAEKYRQRIAELEQIVEAQAHNLREANGLLEKKVLPRVIIQDAERYRWIFHRWISKGHTVDFEYWYQEKIDRQMQIDAEDAMREGER